MNCTVMFAAGICVGAGAMIFLWLMHCALNATSDDGETVADK